MSPTTRLAAGALAALLTSCATTGEPTDAPGSAPAASAPADLDRVRSFDGTSGSPVTPAELTARMRAADVVVLGELHGHPVGLPAFAEAFDKATEHEPAAALALEFLTRETQHLVDAYLDGLLDDEALVEACAPIAGSNAADHLPMIRTARERGLPVRAANAPRLYTRTASREGYGRLAELSGSQRALFAVPRAMPSGPYEEAFFAFMSGHGGGDPDAEPSDRVRGSYRAQSLWDSTMADTVAGALRAGRAPVFLVVGQFHCDRDGGTVQVLRDLAPDAEMLVVSVAPTWAEDLRDEDRGKADVVVHVGPFPE